MKKAILFLALATSLSAQANFGDFFDFAKIAQGLLMVADAVNEGLEKIHVIQKEKIDVAQQWESVCNVTVNLNKSVEAVSELLTKYSVDTRVCAPITHALNLQASIISHCHAYYNDSVPMNSDYVLEAFSRTIEESSKILTQCYPFLNNTPYPQLR